MSNLVINVNLYIFCKVWNVGEARQNIDDLVI